MASLPVGDWEFWVASGVALLALVVLVRAVVPWRMIFKPRRPRGVPTGLTIERRPAGRRSCH